MLALTPPSNGPAYIENEFNTAIQASGSYSQRCVVTVERIYPFIRFRFSGTNFVEPGDPAEGNQGIHYFPSPYLGITDPNFIVWIEPYGRVSDSKPTYDCVCSEFSQTVPAGNYWYR